MQKYVSTTLPHKETIGPFTRGQPQAVSVGPQDMQCRETTWSSEGEHSFIPQVPLAESPQNDSPRLVTKQLDPLVSVKTGVRGLLSVPPCEQSGLVVTWASWSRPGSLSEDQASLIQKDKHRPLDIPVIIKTLAVFKFHKEFWLFLSIGTMCNQRWVLPEMLWLLSLWTFRGVATISQLNPSLNNPFSAQKLLMLPTSLRLKSKSPKPIQGPLWPAHQLVNWLALYCLSLLCLECASISLLTCSILNGACSDLHKSMPDPQPTPSTGCDLLCSISTHNGSRVSPSSPS
jgi:hypothetical protein